MHSSSSNYVLCLLLFILASLITPLTPYFVEKVKSLCWGKIPKALVYADPSNCQTYYKCINGIQYKARCRPGTFFRKKTQRCEYDESIPCSAVKISGHELVGTPCKINGEVRPSEVSCGKYLLCQSNKFIIRLCPFGLIFSDEKHKCVQPPDPCQVNIDDENERTKGKINILYN